MKYSPIITTLLLLCLPFFTSAQDINWRSLNPDNQHLVTATFGADYSLYYGLSYGYQIKNKLAPLVAGIEFNAPVGDQILDDWKLKWSIQRELWHRKGFSFSVKPAFVLRRYDSDIARLHNFGVDITTTIGYLQPRWGIVALANYDRSMSTYIKNERLKAYYPGIRDGWYSGSGGNFKFGTRANITVQSWSVFLQTGKAYGQNFKNNPTLPFYAELSLQKRF